MFGLYEGSDVLFAASIVLLPSEFFCCIARLLRAGTTELHAYLFLRAIITQAHSAF